MKSLIDIVPEDWQTTKLKFFSNTYSGGTPSRGNASYYGGNIPWVKSCELKNKYLYATEECITEDGLNNSSAKMIAPETILFALYGATAGDLCILKNKACCNQAVLAIPIRKDFIEREYLYYFLKFKSTKLRFVTQGGGQPNLSKGILDNLFVSCPANICEQRAIAGILAKVDEAIEAVENSIKAAERLKRALMQNLLSGKLKPDGTWRKPQEFYVNEKFGRIPLGWSLLPIGHSSICEINPSYSFEKEKEYDFLPMEAIRESFGGIEAFEKKIIVSGGYTRFQNGDILFAKITPCAENGKVALVEGLTTEVGFASTEFIVLRPKPRIHKKFFFYLLTTEFVHRLAISLMEGTTGRQRIPWKVFKNRIFCPFPDCEHEQKAIAERIQCFDDLQKHKKIELLSLSNLKKALMQNLLTGKVRVDVEKINQLLAKDTELER